ncbi:glycosyl transferase family 1 [Acidocella aquatica]|uniref:Glycosyl transferase family 1 n=1 Tax=Acidocella aquatica TaxID=1922313 RepID=A0ABQ6A8D3_9PROT|nr:glycosyltransferase family 4 protein [Acidocella aquatica]GLR67913.1 glycosyl transferase family 1 [Acidocella aquatica]
MNPRAAARTLLFLLTEDWFFASHFLARAQAAQAAGWRVIVLASPSEATARIRAAGIEVIPVDFSRRRLNPLAELRLALQLARLYRQLKPDVVHHIALKPIVIGGLAARLAGVRAIVNAPTGLGFVFSSPKPLAQILRPFVTLALRLTLSPKGAKVIFENPDDLQALTAARMLRPGAAVLIPGAGVNLDEFAPAPEPPGAIRVILIARMIHAKGIATFCEAARLLRGQAEFILVGAPDPGNPDSLTAPQLQAWANEGILTWLGPRSDIAALLGGAHIACQPSTYREGLPKSALEAMAAGRPLVASGIPGLREAVVDGQTGILFPPGDAPALAAALAKLIASPALRARMGAAARSRAAEKFSEPRICAQTLLVYEALISGAPP